jgi:hypothetical protein
MTYRRSPSNVPYDLILDNNNMCVCVCVVQNIFRLIEGYRDGNKDTSDDDDNDDNHDDDSVESAKIGEQETTIS